MSAVEIDHTDRVGCRRDGVALLDALRAGQREIEQHLVKLALGPLEARDLGGGLEAGRHLWRLGENEIVHRLHIGSRGFLPHQLPRGLTQQGHDGGAFTAGDLRQGCKHGFVLGQALAAFGFGQLIGHGKKVDSTLCVDRWLASFGLVGASSA